FVRRANAPGRLRTLSERSRCHLAALPTEVRSDGAFRPQPGRSDCRPVRPDATSESGGPGSFLALAGLWHPCSEAQMDVGPRLFAGGAADPLSNHDQSGAGHAERAGAPDPGTG